MERAKVLLIDDDPVLRKLCARELEREGYAVLTAASGREGVEAVREVPPDLVVLDIAMPHLDGLSTLSRILEWDNTIPVVIHTAYAGYKDNFMSWAADAYLIKSSDPSELLVTVRSLLRKRRLPVGPGRAMDRSCFSRVPEVCLT